MLTGVLGFFAQEQVQEHIAERAAKPRRRRHRAELLFYIGPLPVTNTILTAWIVMIILVLFAYLLDAQA